MLENKSNQINSESQDSNASRTSGGVDRSASLGKMQENATDAINTLPQSPQPDEPGIKELLEQLKLAINASDDLPDAEKADALQHVQILAEAGRNPAEPQHQSMAASALDWLKQKTKQLDKSSSVVQVCNVLMPQLKTIFGVE
jgi:hypothetical protein